MGAKVIAAASSEEKLAFCRKLGADDTIDYQKADLRQRAVSERVSLEEAPAAMLRLLRRKVKARWWWFPALDSQARGSIADRAAVLKRRIARVAKRMAKAHGAEGCAPALTFRLR